jgi:DNA polymerase III delta prime subunit
MIIEVPDQNFVEPIARLLRKHMLGPEAEVIDGDNLKKDATVVAGFGTVVLFKAKDDDKPRKSSSASAEFAAAVQRRCAVIGIAANPESQLPRDLVRLAEHRIVVPTLDASAIAAVIEAVTGRRPDAVDDELVRRTSLQALNIAVRSDLGAERSLARLCRLLEYTDQDVPKGPLLSEMHGLGTAKQFGLDLVADLRAHISGSLPAGSLPRGLILSGLPGTGKTSYARALAREVGDDVHFISTSYSQWQSQKEGHLGNVTQAIRATFAEANAQRPCIVYIDEIDSLPARASSKNIDSLPTRGSSKNDDFWVTAVTNCLLECLDGYAKREDVFVIAACNDASRLDPALVRSGRLDRHIEIKLPDVPALIGIFRMYLGKEFAGADLRAAALAARGHTGADVERWMRQARRVARVANRALVLADVLDAVRGGEPEWPADVRQRVGYHEAAHAIAVLALGLAAPTALSIGGTGGLSESDMGEMRALTRLHLEQVLVALLAGRAAEQLVFGEATAGAGGSEDSDLARATQLATRLETSYGLGSFGLICIASDTSDRDLLMFGDLRSAVGRTIDRAYAAALDILRQNRHTLDALAAALFTGGYLDRGEIDAVLAKAPLRTKATIDASSVQNSQQPTAVRDVTDITIAEAPPINSGQ